MAVSQGQWPHSGAYGPATGPMVVQKAAVLLMDAAAPPWRLPMLRSTPQNSVTQRQPEPLIWGALHIWGV